MATKPKIERVSFQVPQSQSGVLVDKGVILAPHTGKLEGGGTLLTLRGLE